MTGSMSASYERPNLKVKSTRSIPRPNSYIQALGGEFSSWAYDEEQCLAFKGKWRSEVFKTGKDALIDLEIGTGNGTHFAYHAQTQVERFIVGFELKYKPLIQSIRRAVRDGCTNARICRYDARLVCDVFAPSELSDVFVHFPDPYLKKRFHKKRLLNANFLQGLHQLQRENTNLFFKTDSEEYYDWAMENIRASRYSIVGESRDLHRSQYADGNFVTAFENIFLRKNQPIFYAWLRKVRSD